VSAHPKTKMEAENGAKDAFEALAGLPKLSELTRVAEGVLFDAARAPFTNAEGFARTVEELGLVSEDGETPFGNALRVLEHGPEDAAEQNLAAALAAHVLSEAPPRGKDAEDGRAEALLRLATRSGVDALALLDRALGDGAVDVWTAIAEGVRTVDSGSAKTLSRAEAIVGAAALASSSSDAATKVRRKLQTHLRDPLLVRVLTEGGDESEPSGSRRLEGELTEAPRSAVRTTLLAVTGLLFVMSLLRILGALALVYKRPAEVVVSKSGVRVRAKTMLLGRTLREIDTHVSLASLVRASREVRYPRAGLYAGLFALAIGSYVGLSVFVDGVRAASPSMLLTGLVVVALGIALDFGLGAVARGSKGKCSVSFQPSTGSMLCIKGVDAKSADLALGFLRNA
jgi:hypothetical protein